MKFPKVDNKTVRGVRLLVTEGSGSIGVEVPFKRHSDKFVEVLVENPGFLKKYLKPFKKRVVIISGDSKTDWSYSGYPHLQVVVIGPEDQILDVNLVENPELFDNSLMVEITIQRADDYPGDSTHPIFCRITEASEIFA